MWKSIHCLLNVKPEHMENYIHCLFKGSIGTTWGKPHSLLSERTVSKLKEIHSPLMKYAGGTHGNPHSLLFEEDSEKKCEKLYPLFSNCYSTFLPMVTAKALKLQNQTIPF